MDERLERVVNLIKSGDREGAFSHLLRVYYRETVLQMENYKGKDPYDTLFPDELCQPLEERATGIAEALNILLEIGCDIKEDSNHYDPPMMDAVSWADAYMTQFLILHGAVIDIDFDDEPPELHQNYYLEDIDIQFMNNCWGKPPNEKYIHALLETACTIARDGHIDSFGGFCLLVKDHEVSLNSPKLVY